MEQITKFLRRLAQGFALLGLAAAVGAVTGVLDAVFGKGVDWMTEVRAEHLWLMALLPAAGLTICLAYEKLGPECRKGIRLVFGRCSGEQQEIPLRLIPLAVGSTWLGHLTGASVGREGVAVQMGATVSSLFARPVKDQRMRRQLLMAGVAAGFAGLFRTPITAVAFSAELFFQGTAEYAALLPAAVAAYAAYGISGLLGVTPFAAQLGELPQWNALTMARIALLGVICGLAGALFARLLHRGHEVLEQRIPNAYWRAAAAGLLAAAAGFCTGGRYNGVGEALLAAPFGGGMVYAWDWLAKMLLTVLCLSAGFQGGEVLPLFTVGATLGAVAGPLLGLPPTLAAGLGYTAVFCGGTNTFWAAVLVGAELFGPQYLPLFFLVCAVAYHCNGNSSIYPQKRKERDVQEALHK